MLRTLIQGKALEQVDSDEYNKNKVYRERHKKEGSVTEVTLPSLLPPAGLEPVTS